MTHSHLHPITSNWLNQWATNIVGSTIFKYNTVNFHLFLLILFHGGQNVWKPTVINQSNKQFKTIINNRFIFPQEQKLQLQFLWSCTFLCKRPHTCKQTCISFTNRDWQGGILEKLKKWSWQTTAQMWSERINFNNLKTKHVTNFSRQIFIAIIHKRDRKMCSILCNRNELC